MSNKMADIVNRVVKFRCHFIPLKFQNHIREIIMISERIRTAREAKSMTKAELARQVSVSRASVSMWEDGKNISVANIHKISEVLGITPQWLQYGVNDSPIQVDELAECLVKTRQIGSQCNYNLSDSQHAKFAAHLYQEQSKGTQNAEEVILNMMRSSNVKKEMHANNSKSESRLSAV